MASLTARDILDERITAFEATTPVEDAIDKIRNSTGDSEAIVYYGYVVDEDGTLTGVVSLRELLNAPDEQPVEEVATTTVVYVEASDSIEHVSRTFSRHQFMALPVVDEDDQLLGVVRANTTIEALDEEQSKDVLMETIRDVPYDPNDERTFECFECGSIIQTVGSPGSCPQCGGSVRHRGTPIE